MAEDSVSDEFDMTIDYSTIYVLVEFTKYASILLSLYGFMKKRAYIYELFKKDNYQYRKYEEAIVGKEYHKNIQLIKEDIVNAFILWNILEEKTIA